ncbi:MAG: hypothetical protein FWD69_10185 [Polyangiaceae bacterium]|nr:hypothetical protein [Polyangiaceae bacterium]
MEYVISSVKTREKFDGSLAEAIERGKVVEAEHQPAWGVDISDDQGHTVATIEDGAVSTE